MERSVCSANQIYQYNTFKMMESPCIISAQDNTVPWPKIRMVHHYGRETHEQGSCAQRYTRTR